VKRAKTFLIKARESGQNIQVALLEYRATPSCLGYSPAELLAERKVRYFYQSHRRNLFLTTSNTKLLEAEIQKEQKMCLSETQ